MGGAPGHSKLCFLKLLWECAGSSFLGRALQEGEAGMGLSRKALDQEQTLTESRALCSAGKSRVKVALVTLSFTWETSVLLTSY